jgi:hypothetical protein
VKWTSVSPWFVEETLRDDDADASPLLDLLLRHPEMFAKEVLTHALPSSLPRRRPQPTADPLDPSLFFHRLPVYPCTLAATSSLAWPLVPSLGARGGLQGQLYNLRSFRDRMAYSG